jgi:hypothetical protein
MIFIHGFLAYHNLVTTSIPCCDAISFRLERVLFRPGGVNLRSCLCGVPMYASAQSLDFLAWTKKPSFPNRKLIVSNPVFPDEKQSKFPVEKASMPCYPLLP